MKKTFKDLKVGDKVFISYEKGSPELGTVQSIDEIQSESENCICRIQVRADNTEKIFIPYVIHENSILTISTVATIETDLESALEKAWKRLEKETKKDTVWLCKEMQKLRLIENQWKALDQEI